MDEMVFKAIKQQLKDNSTDSFTYQQIEKRMNMEGTDNIRKCIKKFLNDGVVENKKKAKKFVQRMNGQLELVKKDYRAI